MEIKTLHHDQARVKEKENIGSKKEIDILYKTTQGVKRQGNR